MWDCKFDNESSSTPFLITFESNPSSLMVKAKGIIQTIQSLISSYLNQHAWVRISFPFFLIPHLVLECSPLLILFPLSSSFSALLNYCTAKSGINKLKADIECMSKEKGEICSQILERQIKISSLESSSSTLAQVPSYYVYATVWYRFGKLHTHPRSHKSLFNTIP